MTIRMVKKSFFGSWKCRFLATLTDFYTLLKDLTSILSSLAPSLSFIMSTMHLYWQI